MSEKMSSKQKTTPDLSMVMPCYNEEDILEYAIEKLVVAFEESGHQLELIAVDNGSNDKTGAMIQAFSKKFSSVIYHRVDVNQGYGNGVLEGLKVATAPWVGMIPADGQVDAEDVVKLFEAILSTDGNVVGKVRRRFRMDGVYRKLISYGFNSFVRILWPRLESIDINGSPKILPAKLLEIINLQSTNWLLDAELMIKAHYLGVRILELNVFARMRGNGLSHVQIGTCFEFFKHLLILRFSPSLNPWKKIKFSELNKDNSGK